MLKISDCNHLRIGNSNAYGMDVEKIVQSIEKEYKVDIRSLPQWKELVKRIILTTTDCNRRIQDSKHRKMYIIQKLYTEHVRLSPFELTNNLARTSKKWQNMENQKHRQKISLNLNTDISAPQSSYTSLVETSDGKLTAHPNTEILPSEEMIEMPLKSEPEIEAKISTLSHLPVNICINQHKVVSPLTTPYSYLSYKTKSTYEELEMKTISERNEKESLLLNKSLSIISSPKEIIVYKDSLQKQVIKFSLTNHSTKFVYIRFVRVTNKLPFRWASISPVTSVKLCPGISNEYRFIFKLLQNIEDFESYLYFKIGHDALTQAPFEAVCIPIQSRFNVSKPVSVSKVVFIPPTYPWHLRNDCGFPSGYIKLSVDKNTYNLHIIKRIVDFTAQSKDDLSSLKVMCPNTESLKDRTEDQQIETQSKLLTYKDNLHDITSIKSIDVIILVVNDIIELALNTFIFEHSYLKLLPHSKHKILVYFTKVERIGSHHSYYDFEFYDPNTEKLIMTKEVKIFAEVLPHPITIYPSILDMSKSPMMYGFCEDYFTITNSNKVYPVTIKIMLTTKMKKILHIRPTETLLPATSSVKFEVKFCSPGLIVYISDDLVLFTFKIIIKGNQTIYHHVPPFFYEIIAPCVPEYKKYYGE
ncbi:uncharacterized protein LOC131853875 [Achroia grisella]|uniref:uncharacterized protein LOC131853875 n=1 Tax=Achroia grisella TaxID=688607 RepID=UPI0027D27A2B|nr:uncharacterized protein LOC131853875 [Achroia grisella]